MAKKMTPSELRSRAKAMLWQAKQEEDKLYIKIGRLVEKELKKEGSFSSDSAKEIKMAIKELIDKIDKIVEG